MEDRPSTTGGTDLQRHLGHAEVLERTLDQLRKDLALGSTELSAPADPANAFEDLRVQVLPVLRTLEERGAQAVKVAMYRVDIPEPHLRRAMAAGGLDALAGEVVLRALQKVLTRLRFAGRY